MQVTADEVIIVDVPEYVKKFTSYVRGVAPRVQANYLLWRAAAASMKYLNEKARKISLKFSQKLTGKIEETPRFVFFIVRPCGDTKNMYTSQHFFSLDGEPVSETPSEACPTRSVRCTCKSTSSRTPNKQHSRWSRTFGPSSTTSLKRSEKITYLNMRE